MQIVTCIEDLQRAIKEIEKYSTIGFDVESTGLSPHYDKLLLISIAVSSEESYVIDFTHIDIKHFNLLAPILTSSSILKLGFNLVFDWKMVYGNTKVEVINMFDAMIAEQLLSAGLWVEPVKGSTFSLAAVTYRRLGKTRDKDIRKQFIGFQGRGFEYEAYYYAAEDTQDLFLMYEQQLKEIREKELEKVCALEMSLIACTSMMEYTGILVDREKLESLIEPFSKYVQTCHRALQDIFIEAGAADEILFDKSGYIAINPASKPNKKTGNDGQMLTALRTLGINLKSLSAKEIVKWDFKNSGRHEAVAYTDLIEDENVADALEKYGGLENPYLRMFSFLIGAEKLLGTYVIKQLERIDKNTGRLYGWFKTLGARSTGRYSSNLQQIPKDDKLERLGLKGHSIRQCFIASSGRNLILADFSGIELFILADMSRDEKLAHEITHGDIHSVVTKTTLGKFIPDALDITAENKKKRPYSILRDGAKTESFGIAYGVTGASLSEQLTIKFASLNVKITKEQGDELIRLWKQVAFPDAGRWLDDTGNKAVTDGYVTDAWGRRRNWNKADFENKWRMFAAQREGKNAPIQMTSATMTKRAMVLTYDRLDKRRGRIIMSVHDEIVLEVVESYTEQAMLILKECMEQAARETMPFMGQYVEVTPEFSKRYDK